MPSGMNMFNRNLKPFAVDTMYSYTEYVQ